VRDVIFPIVMPPVLDPFFLELGVLRTATWPRSFDVKNLMLSRHHQSPCRQSNGMTATGRHFLGFKVLEHDGPRHSTICLPAPRGEMIAVCIARATAHFNDFPYSRLPWRQDSQSSVQTTIFRGPTLSSRLGHEYGETCPFRLEIFRTTDRYR